MEREKRCTYVIPVPELYTTFIVIVCSTCGPAKDFPPRLVSRVHACRADSDAISTRTMPYSQTANDGMRSAKNTNSIYCLPQVSHVSRSFNHKGVCRVRPQFRPSLNVHKPRSESANKGKYLALKRHILSNKDLSHLR